MRLHNPCYDYQEMLTWHFMPRQNEPHLVIKYPRHKLAAYRCKKHRRMRSTLRYECTSKRKREMKQKGFRGE